MWVFAVDSLTKSCLAMPATLIPSASSRSTWPSRGESWGPVGAGLPYGFGGRRGLADHLELAVALERVPETLADKVMIIDEQHLGARRRRGASGHTRYSSLLVLPRYPVEARYPRAPPLAYRSDY